MPKLTSHEGIEMKTIWTSNYTHQIGKLMRVIIPSVGEDKVKQEFLDTCWNYKSL